MNEQYLRNDVEPRMSAGRLVKWVALVGCLCAGALASRAFTTNHLTITPKTPSNTASTVLLGQGQEQTPRRMDDNGGSLMILTREVINNAYDVLLMTHQLYQEDPTIPVPGAMVYTDEPDRALWVKRNNTCFAAFRATTPQASDWWQNFPIGDPVSFQSPLNHTCTAYKGFYDAYFNTSFVDTYREDLRACVNSCGDEPCQLVVGGASQGAGIAAVAAVDFEDMNPTLLTFGQPPTLISERDGPCDAINVNRYLRFINTVEGPRPFTDGIFLLYDLVPALIIRNRTDNIGNFLVLSENKGVLMFPHEGRPFLRPTLWSKDAHLIVAYLPRLAALLNYSEFPIPVRGWAGGSRCNFDVECESGECSHRNCTAVESTSVSGGDKDGSTTTSGTCSLGTVGGLVHWLLLGVSLFLVVSHLR